jgi:hypothetical protein
VSHVLSAESFVPGTGSPGRAYYSNLASSGMGNSKVRIKEAKVLLLWFPNIHASDGIPDDIWSIHGISASQDGTIAFQSF